MASNIKELGVKTKWQDLTEGMIIVGAGTSKEFKTGEWSSVKPQFIEDKCKQCLLCYPVCPDASVIVDKETGKMTGIDLEHCKGCGVCAKTCPLGAYDLVENK